MCNNFAQAVMRTTRTRLKDSHPEEYAQIKAEVEHELYPQAIQNYHRTTESHP